MKKHASLICVSIGLTLAFSCKTRDEVASTVKAGDAPGEFVTVTLDSSGAISGDESAASIGSPRFLAVFAEQTVHFNVKEFYPDATSVRAVHGAVDGAFNYRPGTLGVFDDKNCHIDGFRAVQESGAGSTSAASAKEELAGIDCLKVERESGEPSYVMITLTPAAPALSLSGDAYDHHLIIKMYAEAFGGAGNGGDLVMGPAVDHESDCRFGVGVSGGLSAQVYGFCSYTWQSSRSTAFSSVTFTKMGVQASIFDIPALPLYAVMISTDEGNRVRGPFNCASIAGAMAFGSAMTASTTWDCNATSANRAVKTILWNEYL